MFPTIETPREVERKRLTLELAAAQLAAAQQLQKTLRVNVWLNAALLAVAIVNLLIQLAR